MATSGKHGRPSVLALKQYGTSAYTEIAEVRGEYRTGLMFNMVDLDDVHGQTLMSRLADPMARIPPVAFQAVFDIDGATHDASTGLEKWNQTTASGLREETSIELRGPDYLSPSTDVVEISGFVSKAERVYPPDGAYTLDVEFTPSGNLIKIDGTTIT